MIKTILYIIVTILVGAWMIYQLYQSPELSNTKSDIENYYYHTQKMIDKL
jgi:hypothetical protein